MDPFEEEFQEVEGESPVEGRPDDSATVVAGHADTPLVVTYGWVSAESDLAIDRVATVHSSPTGSTEWAA